MTKNATSSPNTVSSATICTQVGTYLNLAGTELELEFEI